MTTLTIAGTIPSSIHLQPQDFLTLFEQFITLHPDSIHGEVELRFVGPKTMRDLNRRYADNDSITDVLSFAYDEPEELILPEQASRLGGTIVICTAQLLRQALSHKQRPSDEAALLCVHGLLHIAGFDHQAPKSQAGFAKLQDDIMRRAQYRNRDFSWSH